MSCATSTLKFTAFVMNLLCCIFGALTLSASSYALVNFDATDAIRIPCIIGITLGSLLFLTTILGCIGAIRDSVRMTWIYVTILFILMGAQIAVIFAQSVDFRQLAKETIDNAWNREMNENGTMSAYEIKYGCCGKIGSSDYIQSGLKIPSSCYLNQNATVPSNLYSEGCEQVLAEAFSNGARIEEISDWSLVGVEGVTIVVAGMLAISLKNMERRRLYH